MTGENKQTKRDHFAPTLQTQMKKTGRRMGSKTQRRVGREQHQARLLSRGTKNMLQEQHTPSVV